MEKQTTSKFNSLGVKIIILGLLCIVSMIPIAFTVHTIEERQEYQKTAIESVVGGWANRQKLGSMHMEVPYSYKYISSSDNKKIETLHENYIAIPSKLVVHASDTTEFRKRGIFEIPVYNSDVTMEGKIKIPSDLTLKSEAEVVTPKLQKLVITMPSSKSISDFSVEIDGKPVGVKRLDAGLAVEFKEKTWPVNSEISFKVKMKLKGFEGIDFSSTAEDFEVYLDSTWPHPSFLNQLPTDHTINANGFAAHWKLTQPTSDQILSVNYIEPVNVYSQSLRAIKYSFLICLLTLGVLFLIEILAQFKIHPMQYLLMILPLSVFYVLLIALSEYIGFAWAYSLASIAIISLLLVYFKGIGAKTKQFFGLGGVLVALFSLIYVMLSAEDSALLIGAISLFICLASFMWLTRKIDWQVGLQA